MKAELSTAEKKSGVSKKSGNEYTMYIQQGWIHGADKYPLRFERVVFDSDDVLPPGEYDVRTQVEVINDRLRINPVFVPAKK